LIRSFDLVSYVDVAWQILAAALGIPGGRPGRPYGARGLPEFGIIQGRGRQPGKRQLDWNQGPPAWLVGFKQLHVGRMIPIMTIPQLLELVYRLFPMVPAPFPSHVLIM